MTEKRFELILCSNGSYYLWDNGDLTDISFDKFNKEDAEEMCNLLNELHKLNEQLKKKYHTVQKVFEESQNEWADSVNKLHEENIQYKQELDNIYLLIGRGDWSGLVDLIKGDVE